MIGGTPRLLAIDSNRRILRDQPAYYEEVFKHLDITLSLGARVSADDLVDFGTDVIIIATGGRP